MTSEEPPRFLEEELKGLWPEWNPTNAEMCVWTAAIKPLTYALARSAAQASFRQQRANYRRPVLSRFIEQVHILGRSTNRRRERPDPTTTVYIECIEAPPGKPHLRGVSKGIFTTRQDDPDHVLACAESMRKHFSRLYGGHWITLQTRPPQDDGRPGPAAGREPPGTRQRPSQTQGPQAANATDALHAKKFDEK